MKQRLGQYGPVLLLIAILVILSSVATYLQLRQEVDHATLSISSNEPDGARALVLWLEDLGYEPGTETAARFGPPEEASVAFILEPSLPGLTVDQWRALERWIEAGGTLYVIGEGFGTALSLQRFAFDIAYREDLEGPVEAADPAFATPELEVLSNLQPRAVLQTNEADHRPLITIEDELLAAEITHGEGMVIVSTLTYPFTNRGLKDAGNGDFVLSMLDVGGTEGVMWFDEWHHGAEASMASAPAGLSGWLRTSRPGQAVLYSAAVIFLWLLLSGRRFGRPIRQSATVARRAPVEHVLALANLSRQAGHRHAVAGHLRRELKTQLGYRYGLAAAMSDEQFIQQLIEARPDLNQQGLQRLFASLGDRNLRESELLRLAQETSEWIER